MLIKTPYQVKNINMLNSGYIPFSILLEVWCQEHADLDTETEL